MTGTINSFEEYKKNLQNLEKRLQNLFGNDLANEIQVAITWLTYHSNGSANGDEAIFFRREAIHAMIKGVLSRKKDISIADAKSFVPFLENCSKYLSTQINLDETLGRTVELLFDPNQPLYQKLFSATAENNATNKRLKSFVDTLDAGSCIDYLNSSGKWEVVFVEKLSQFRTEVEVALPNDSKVWINLEKDMYKLAPFGTKTSVDSNAVTDLTEDSSFISSNANDKIFPLNYLPAVGELIDVQNGFGFWYQACVLEVQELVISKSIPVTCPVIVDSKAEQVVVEQTPDMIVIDATDSVPTVNATEFETTSVTETKWQIRVAYIGFGESNDEWVDVSSSRISTLNTMSQGRIGENKIRAEVQYFLRLYYQDKIDYSDEQNRDKKFTHYHESYFVSTSFVSILEAFGRGGGFMRVLSILKQFEQLQLFRQQLELNPITSSPLSPPASTITVLTNVLSYLNFICNVAAFLSPQFLHSEIMPSRVSGSASETTTVSIFGYFLLNTVQNIFKQLTLTDIRVSDTIDQNCQQLESLAHVIIGRNRQCGEFFEPFRLQLGIKFLLSPYLNRRLGGIKIIQELLRRAQNAVDYPTGLHVLMVPPATSSTMIGPQTAANSTTHVNIDRSYQLMPINYYLTTPQICLTLMEEKVYDLLYMNVDIHESIISRSASILTALLEEDIISAKMIEQLLHQGITHQPAILKLLTEVIGGCPYLLLNELVLKINSLLFPSANGTIDSSLQFPQNILELLIDIIAAAGIQGRNRLLQIEKFTASTSVTASFTASNLSDTTRTKTVEMSVVTDDTTDCTTAAANENLVLLSIHQESLSSLWNTILIGSNKPTVLFPTSLVQLIITKVETILELGIGHNHLEEMPWESFQLFPWHLHQQRITSILNTAVLSLQHQAVLVPAMKIIQACIYAFPMHANRNHPKDFVEMTTDRKPYVRFNFVNELIRNESYALFSKITNAIMSIKKSFETGINSTEINACGNLRHTYMNQLESLLDLFYVLFRSHEKSFIPVDCLSSLWDQLIVHATMQDEFDLMVGFLSKFPTRIVESPTPVDTTATVIAPVETTTSIFFHKSRNEFLYLFEQMLCDNYGEPAEIKMTAPDSQIMDTAEDFSKSISEFKFLSSKYFNLKAWKCIEKWFRFVNKASLTFSDGKDSSKIIATSRPLADFTGIRVLLLIILHTQTDFIASSVVNFIMTLLCVPYKPATILPEENESSVATNFRQQLFQHCVDQLKKLANEVGGEHSMALSRMLLLFNGLLDESYNAAASVYNMRLFAHEHLLQGHPVTLRIGGTSRNIKNLNIEINIFSHERIGDIISRVSALINVPLNDFKIFRLGKELTSQEFNKILSQLPLGSDKENFVIAEKPAHLKQNSASSSNVTGELVESVATNAESNFRKEDILVLGVASQYELIEIFFHLLREEKDEIVINNIWNTVSQLPTSKPLLMRWVFDISHLTTISASHVFGFDLNSEAYSRMAEVLYHLQIIELLLHPVTDIASLIKTQYFSNDSESHIPPFVFSSWVNDFLAKQGMWFLYQCYDWISSFGPQWCQSNYLNYPGVSTKLVLTMSRLLHKLLRAWILPLLTIDEGGNQARFVTAFLQQTHGSSNTTSGALLNSSTTVDNQNKEETKLTSEDISVPPQPLETVSNVATLVNQYEWGKSLYMLFSSPQNESIQLLKQCISVLPLDELFWLILCQLYSLSTLENHGKISNIFQKTTSVLAASVSTTDSSEETYRYTLEKLYVAGLLQDLLFVWSSITLLQPSVCATSFDKAPISSFSFTFSMFLSSGLIFASPSVTTNFVSVVHDEFPILITNYMRFIIDYADTVQNKAYGKDFQLKLLEKLLPMRPTIESTYTTLDSALATSRGHLVKQQAIFDLLVTLLRETLSNEPLVSINSSSEVGNITTTNISSEIYRNTCLSIFHELQLIVTKLQKQEIISCQNVAGNVQLLEVLVRFSDNYLYRMISEKFVPFFLVDMLGLVPIPHRPSYYLPESICPRCITYAVVRAFCETYPQISLQVYEYILQLQNSIQPHKDQWDYAPEKEVMSTYGYKGIRNFGATCYMNSLLQVFYMNEEFRSYLLSQYSFDDYCLAAATTSRFQWEELLKRNLVYQFQKLMIDLNYNEKKFVIPTDWVYALQNDDGETLQILAKNPEITSTAAIPASNPTATLGVNMFGERMNIMQQQDVQEFLLLVCTKYELAVQQYRQHHELCAKNAVKNQEGINESIEAHETKSIETESAPKLPQDILRLCYGVGICDQRYVAPKLATVSALSTSTANMDLEENENEVTNETPISIESIQEKIALNSTQESIKQFGIRESEEMVYCISVNVQGCSSLTDSLQQYIQGETLTDYQWKDSDTHKSTIIKKQCFSSLSNSIIFHLQRFCLNFDTFQREKLNNYYSFPKNLNMKKYMKEYQESYLPSDERENHLLRESDYYDYEISGVIVHTGTSDSGHYYSFIKDTKNVKGSSNGGDSNAWLEFNDSEIKIFNFDTQLESECFGGTTSIHEYLPSAQSFVLNQSENSKSAYMVVYTRVRKLPLPDSVFVHPVRPSQESSELSFTSSLLQQYKKKIEEENTAFQLNVRLLGKEFIQFYDNLIRNVFSPFISKDIESIYAEYDDKELTQIAKSIQEIVHFLLYWIAHTLHTEEFKNIAVFISSLTQKYDKVIEHFKKRISLLHQAKIIQTMPVGTREIASIEADITDFEIIVTNDHTTIPAVSADITDVSVGMIIDDETQRMEDNQTALLTTTETIQSTVSMEVETDFDVIDVNDFQRTDSITMDTGMVLLPPLPPTKEEEEAAILEHTTTSTDFLRADTMSMDIGMVLPPPPPTKEEESKAINAQGIAETEVDNKSDIVTSTEEGETVLVQGSSVPNTGELLGDSTELISLTTTELSTMATSPQSNTFLPFISSRLLKEINNDFMHTMDTLLVTKDEFRKECGSLYSQLINQSWEYEQPVITSIDTSIMRHGTMSTVFLNTVPSSTSAESSSASVGGGTSDMIEDPDLLLAIKLSQEAESASIAALQTSSNNNNTQPAAELTPTLLADFITDDMNIPTVVYTVIELTMDTSWQRAAEQWRKAESFHKLMLTIGKACAGVRRMFIERETISQLIDLILGDSSPLCGKLYTAGKRKRCPSSFVTLHLSNKDYTVSQQQQLRNLPDWSSVLELWLLLLAETATPAVSTPSNQPQPLQEIQLSQLSVYDQMCINHKGLYTTLLKQSRYLPYLLQCIQLVMVNNFAYTNLWIEILKEEMSTATVDNMPSLFAIWKAMFQLNDNYQKHRAFELLGLTSANNIMNIFKNHRTNTSKQYIVVSFIRSFIVLLSEFPALFEVLGSSNDSVYAWAPWMVQFSKQLVTSTTPSTTSPTTNTTAPVVVATTTGPYIIVYGESDAERTIPWSERYQNTFTGLCKVLSDWGFDVDTILTVLVGGSNDQSTIGGVGVNNNSNSTAVVLCQPVSTTVSGTVARPTSSTSQGNAAVSSGVAASTTTTASQSLQLHDGMTDEELMQFLATQSY